MIKFYKNEGQGGNGEFIVQTDAKELDAFVSELSSAIIKFCAENDDLEHAMSWIIPNSLQLAFKIAGYKTDRVHESRILTCGYSTPKECDLKLSIDFSFP